MMGWSGVIIFWAGGLNLQRRDNIRNKGEFDEGFSQALILFSQI
jgi:hypothetical protein